MSKKASRRKTKKKEKRNLSLVISVGAIVLFALIIFFLILDINKESMGKADRECEQDKYWLIDNCECVEWEGERKCPEGFELKDNSVCINETRKTFTNVLISCSKYKCPDYSCLVKGTQ